jgi:hypothetical protein
VTPWERPGALRGLRLGVGAAIAAYLALIAAIVAGDSLAAYPFMHPDSYDWLANGLRYTGVPVASTWRVVLAPFVYAALFALRLENLIPFLGLVAVFGTAAMLLTLGWRAAGAAAVWGALLLAANHLVVGHALSVQPDVWSAGLGLTGLLALAVALEARMPGHLYGAAAALTLGGLAQPATPFLVPACLVMLLYDPDAPRGIGLGTLRWLAGRRETWGAVALAAGILAAAFVARWVLVGVAWPTTAIIHGGWIVPGVFPDAVGFYAFATAADWSIPVLLLALVGAGYGLRRRPWRRLTLGLVVAVLANAGMFTLLYTGYRENRFVVYWTMPALLLAGIGLRSLRPPLALAVAVVAMVATSYTIGHWARPGTEPALVLAPGFVLEGRYTAFEQPWRVEESRVRARPFPAMLARWARERRRLFAQRDGDDVQYARARELLGRLATFHVRPGQALFVHFAPDENGTHVYMLRNQFALYAGRRVQQVALGDPTKPLGRGAVVVLRRTELDRLRDAALLPPGVQVLAERGPWVLLQVGAAQAPAPASSRRMSSSERVRSQPG